MCFYNDGFNILCNRLIFFEMNIMNIKYPKTLLKHYNQCFSLLKRIKKRLETIWKYICLIFLKY